MWPHSVSDIRISVTPISGHFVFLVKTGSPPSEGGYDWRSDSSGSGLIISHADSKFKMRDSYFVLVRATPPSYAGQWASSKHPAFIVKYVTGSTVGRLKNAVAEIGHMKREEYTYYKHQVTPLGSPITISITPFSGDPDLFVSTNTSNQYPNAGRWDLKSSRRGSDSVVVSPERMQIGNPTCKTEGPPLIGGTPCTLFIAVLCSRHLDCRYSIVLKYRDEKAHKLLDGIPQHEYVERNQFRHYFFSVKGTEKSINAVLSPRYGDADLFVYYIRNSTQPISDWPKFALDSLSNADKRSTSRIGSEVIHVNE